MKILKKIINYKQKLFQVSMIVEENTDDCWNIYNLLAKGDYVYGKVHRRV